MLRQALLGGSCTSECLSAHFRGKQDTCAKLFTGTGEGTSSNLHIVWDAFSTGYQALDRALSCHASEMCKTRTSQVSSGKSKQQRRDQ